jgi:putative ABC transport system ATP-binding protein
MSGARIETENLAKDYRLGEHVVHALRGITVMIEPGEFVAVMGASGSGKSTFMNLLGCLDRPTAGTYRLDDSDIAALSADALAHIRNRKVGFVFQNFNLLARTNAAENVELPMLYSDVPPDERRRRALTTLAMVGLKGREHHLPQQLSGGQQQRVAIARAMVLGPSLLLADEPTGALDSHTGLEIMALFQTLNREGITIVLVTHERDIARFARRILSFHDGHVVADERAIAPVDAVAELAKAGPNEVAA